MYKQHGHSIEDTGCRLAVAGSALKIAEAQLDYADATAARSQMAYICGRAQEQQVPEAISCLH